MIRQVVKVAVAFACMINWWTGLTVPTGLVGPYLQPRMHHVAAFDYRLARRPNKINSDVA